MKKQEEFQSNAIQMLTLAALLFAASLVLSIVESSLPPLPIAIPGVKLGLSNIPVMYTLFFLGKRQALTIATLKSLFVGFTRGAVSGLLSFCGGWLSVLAMALLLFLFKDHISYMVISIFGAVFHNVGQFAAISVLYTNLYLWVYLPVLLISGIIAGIATATFLKLILPLLNKVGYSNKEQS